MLHLLLAQLSITPGDDSAELIGRDAIGAVGQLMTAVLQTAGLYAQGEVISFFSGALNSVAAFLYVLSIVMALTTVAMYGSYQKALYFLIGPALFTFMLTETVPASFTRLQYGDRVTPFSDRDQLSFLERISPAFDAEPQVSWFFATYDGVVSSVVQSTVSMLLDTQNRKDLIAKARERLFSRVLTAQAIDPGFKRLLARVIAGECADATRLSMELSQPKLRDATPGTADYTLKTTKQAKLEKLLRNPDGTPLRTISLTPDDIEFAEMYGYREEDLKLGVGCEFAWELTKRAAVRAAEAQLEEFSAQESPSEEIPWNEVRQEVLNAVHPGDETKAISILAAYVLKNSLADTAHSSMMGQLNSRAPFRATMFNGVLGDHQSAMAQGSYMRIVYFSGVIPYIQGIILFLLTAGFPFFAVFLVMPERMTSFFIWMTLWLWVKSWDIGFAFVDVVRDVLFPYLGHSVNLHRAAPNWDDQAEIFNIIYQNDPLANYNTYLMVIGLLRLSVPVVTAHLCLGASTLFQGFQNSMDRHVNTFANQRRNQQRRMFASGTKGVSDLVNAESGYQGALHAAANPGETSTGVNRRFSGSGALARHMHGTANRMAVDSYLSPTEIGYRQHTAGHTGRTMSYFFTYEKALARAAVNKALEEVSVTNAGDQVKGIPGMGAYNYNDSDTSLPDLGFMSEIPGDETGE